MPDTGFILFVVLWLIILLAVVVQWKNRGD